MVSSDDILAQLLDDMEQRGLALYEAQENAILELYAGKNVILNTPTGSGKSLVASALHRLSLAQGRRSVYTCPIKALVNEKWMALCREFGPENVGLSTGDATVHHDAPILCCTAEILSNMALSEGEDCSLLDVVMDEFHYYSDRERGVAWQIPLLTMPQSRFLLMSATLGETRFFQEELQRRTGVETVVVQSDERPVPLHFEYSETPLANEVQKLIHEGKAPVYVVHFTQAQAASNAQNFTSLDLCTREERQQIAAAIQGFRFSSPHGPDIKRWLRMGIGLHHAGLLPKYRILVEKLAQRGLLKVICGTDTLGVGVNVPIRTVLFTQLCKYSGDKTSILTARDFHQISGRAGRRGYDDVGYVVCQAPEHVIENLRNAAKAAQKGGRKFAKKSAPERGYVPWNEEVFQKLILAKPEKLVSSFQVSHGFLLNVLSRPHSGCRALKRLLKENHEPPQKKAEHQKRAVQLFRSLVERQIIELKPHLTVCADLGDDFSMNQTLSLYLIDTLSLLEQESPDYALDVLSLVEAILENPEMILRKQLDLLKGQALAEMKAQGMEYDERMEKLDALEYPKPLREFIYGTFNAFSEAHPWVGSENIRPKSIARELFEEFLTFSGYVKRYGLQRSEGLLLRHLNQVYKVLSSTVPDTFKNDEVREMEEYLGDLIRRVDSSLLEEWERLRNPHFVADEIQEIKPPGAEEAEKDITRNEKTFLASIRARIFNCLSLLQRQDWQGAVDVLSEGLDESFAPVEHALQGELAERVTDYVAQHGWFRLDPEGRSSQHTHVDTSDPQKWLVEQMLQDREDLNDTCVRFEVDLSASRLSGQPILRLVDWKMEN